MSEGDPTFFGRRRDGMVGRGWGRRASGASAAGIARLLRIVDEMAPRPVRAKSDRVESAAQLRLVLGVPDEGAELVESVGELALVPVLARPVLLKGPAQFRLIPTRVALRWLDLDGQDDPMVIITSVNFLSLRLSLSSTTSFLSLFSLPSSLPGAAAGRVRCDSCPACDDLCRTTERRARSAAAADDGPAVA